MEEGVGFKTPDDVLFADNSGTTIRLVTSMCSLVNGGYSILTGDKSLRKRPMGDLIKALNQLGVNCFSTNRNYSPPLVVKGGGMKGGTAQISGEISSQFISSILLSGIYSQTPITIQVLGNQVSKPYIDSTIFTMKKFGVKVETSSNGLFSNNLEMTKRNQKCPNQLKQSQRNTDYLSNMTTNPIPLEYQAIFQLLHC